MCGETQQQGHCAAAPSTHKLWCFLRDRPESCCLRSKVYFENLRYCVIVKSSCGNTSSSVLLEEMGEKRQLG